MPAKSPITSQQAASLSRFYRHLTAGENPPATSSAADAGPVYWPVADLEGAVARARALGGRVLLPPSPPDPVRIAVVTDPEGHVLGLTQAPSA